MIDNELRSKREEAKDRVRRRMRASVDPENYVYYAEKRQVDFYDTDVHQNVGIYVRVSTDDIRQTTSYELQQKYYMWEKLTLADKEKSLFRSQLQTLKMLKDRNAITSEQYEEAFEYLRNSKAYDSEASD